MAANRSRVILGAVVLVAIGLVAYFLLNRDKGAIAAAQGDCIKVVSAADAKTERADCGAPEAVYLVAKKLDSTSGMCPVGEYSELTSGSAKLCLMLNVKVGDCLTTTSAGQNQTHQRVACEAADYRVLKVITSKVGSAACEQGNVVASYTEPPTTICLSVKP
jgi:hypothetical protein